MREGVGAPGAPVEIDGAHGEGGGQILRTSLALSMITGRPLRMQRIRAGRAKPGLRRQHLACVQAAARLCNARVTGDRVGSRELEFEPGPIGGGPAPRGGPEERQAEDRPRGEINPVNLVIDIGTPGATSLVVQTILVPAIAARCGLTARVLGGTHNPFAPPFDFLDRVFLPHLRAMGADVAMTLDRYGFVGGPGRGARRDGQDDETPDRGQVTVTVGAGGALRPIDLLEAGPITARRATSIIARLPTHVAERELGVIRERLGLAAADCHVREVGGGGPANVVLVEIERAGGRELVTQLGEKGLRAELVAARACDEVEAFLGADVPVGEHLADQLLLPLAVAGGGRFRCAPLSSHAVTNIATIRRFLDVPIRVDPDGAAVVPPGFPPARDARPRFAAGELDRLPSVVVSIGAS
jgi:RNA 3'-terminal phosphate cyclase (ATP)